MKRIDGEQAGRAEEHRIDASRPVGRRRDDDRVDAGDLCRNDASSRATSGRPRCRPARRRRRARRDPATFDLDARHDGRARGLGPLRPGEPADVLDRRARERRGSLDRGRRGRRASSAGSIDEAPVGQPATDARFASRTAVSPRARTSSRMVRARSRTRGPAPRPVGRARRRRAATAGCRRQPRRSRSSRAEAKRRRRVTGRSSRSAGRGCRTRRPP